MPYTLVGKCVHKQNADGSTGETVPGGCHKTEEEAKKHMRALYANVKDSGVVEMSMRISKASYNKSESDPMKWSAIDSDVDEDLYQERMSIELYNDFTSRIENKVPIPDPFAEAVCESDWCGGMPYLSIAHYKAGTGQLNVPGLVENVFVDGTRLKSKGTLHDNEMGRRVFNALREDLYMKEKSVDHNPVRISIGFLDLEHKHLAPAGGQEFTFTRTEIGQLCPLCAQGVGGKIYMKGQLVHLAMTRVPVNPRTEMVAEKSMDEITTKKKDAASIIGEDLVEALEEKSIAQDVLVVRAGEEGSAPKDDPSELISCYDPNTGGWDSGCIREKMDKYMPGIRNEISETVKSLIRDEVKELAKRKDVSEADKKHAEKEYGDVKYADETNKKYPIDTKEHAKAALSYWGMPKNREKYSPEDQKKIGGRIRAAAKKFGIEVTDKKSDVVEESMDENVEKMVAGGESVPEKKFEFEGVSGDGNNTVASPVKAKTDDEAPEDDEKEMKSALEKSFESLKTLVAQGKNGQVDVDAINKAFASLGTQVENELKPAGKSVDTSDIAEIVKSAVEAAVDPLRIELATLKAYVGKSDTVSQSGVVKSKSLSLNFAGQKPEDVIQRATQQPTRKLSQIEMLARKSTGAPV